MIQTVEQRKELIGEVALAVMATLCKYPSPSSIQIHVSFFKPSWFWLKFNFYFWWFNWIFALGVGTAVLGFIVVFSF